MPENLLPDEYELILYANLNLNLNLKTNFQSQAMVYKGDRDSPHARGRIGIVAKLVCDG